MKKEPRFVLPSPRMSDKEINILKRALDRERAARKESERILEEKSRELYQATQDLERSNKQLEASITEKNSQLQGIFSNIVDPYVVMDLAGNVLRMNRSAEQLLGFSVDNGRRNLSKLVHPDDVAHTLSSFQQMLDKGRLKNFEARFVRADGSIRWVQINASLIYGFHKKPIAAQGIARDITEEKKNAELIINQKRELDVIVDNSSLGIALTQKGKILKVNQAFCQMLGYSEEEMLQKSVSDISYPDDAADSTDSLSLMAEGVIDRFTMSKRYVTRNKTLVWAKTTVNAVRDRSGDIAYEVALIEDITEERELQLMSDLINDVAKAILGEMDLSRMAWQIVHHIANYLNTDDCVIYLVDWEKEQLEQIAAFGSKVIPGEQEVINRLIIPIGKGVVGNVARSGKPELIGNVSDDNRYIVDDQVRLSEIAVPVIYKGKVIAVIDSEHPQENYYTLEQLGTLQKVASVVSVQLESALNLESLKRAQRENQALLEKLELSNSELEEYAHIVSHDLKSPLRNIHALVEWIKEDNKGKLDSNTKENLGMIEDTLQKMEGLISGILSFSSINEESLHLVKTDLYKVVNDAIGLIHVPAQVTIQVAEDLPDVVGDKLRLMQLFQNLIGNAVRYSDKPDSLIEVGCTIKEGRTVYHVRDNGIGIDPAHHERIFKIFQSLSDKQESTGIGLSIVKKIIDLHKGDIWLESEVGSGTTFYFTLD